MPRSTCAIHSASAGWETRSGSSFAVKCFARARVKPGRKSCLVQSIVAAKDLNVITPADLSRVVVDTTVQEKAVAYPAGSRLLEVAPPKKLVRSLTSIRWECDPLSKSLVSVSPINAPRLRNFSQCRHAVSPFDRAPRPGSSACTHCWHYQRSSARAAGDTVSFPVKRTNWK